MNPPGLKPESVTDLDIENAYFQYQHSIKTGVWGEGIVTKYANQYFMYAEKQRFLVCILWFLNLGTERMLEYSPYTVDIPF